MSAAAWFRQLTISRASKSDMIGKSGRLLLQLCVFRFGLLQDGTSESASFQSPKKSWYALLALALSPDST